MKGLYIILTLAGLHMQVTFAAEKPVSMLVENRVLHPVHRELFGQFMERPSWGGEFGAESAWRPELGGLEPRAVELMNEMQLPLVRFPGGTDIDYLDWRDMVTDAHGPGSGRVDSRGHRGQTITNRFGYDEYFRLAAELGWDTVLVVNLRDGLLGNKTPEDAARHAAALLAYCSGRPDEVPQAYAAWPVLRVRNGHAEPYPVSYVQLGNETYFWTGEMKQRFGEDWVRVWADAIQTFITELRRIAPGLRVISDLSPFELSAELARRRAGVDVFAYHYYHPMGIQNRYTAGGEKESWEGATPREMWESMAHSTPSDAEGLAVWQPEPLEHARAHQLAIGMTEWNLNAWWAAPDHQHLWPGAGANGLGAARMLHAMMRNGDRIILANQSLLIGNAWGITAIRVSEDGKTPAHFRPQGKTLAFYNRLHGGRRMKVTCQTPPPMWQAPFYFNERKFPAAEAAFVDALATADDDRVYLHAVNSSYDRMMPLRVEFKGFDLAPVSRVHVLQYHTREEQAGHGAWYTQTMHEVEGGWERTVDLPPRSAVIVETEYRPGDPQ